MKYTADNDYGCKKYNGVSDMDSANGTLVEQLEKAGVTYTRTQLSMGTVTAEPCYLVHYMGRSSNIPVTVLVFPQAGVDSWAEDYYHFPGMTPDDAATLNWYEVHEHIHRVWWDTVKKNVSVAQYCPTCGTAPATTYEDLRLKKRCSVCHELTVDNKAEYHQEG